MSTTRRQVIELIIRQLSGGIPSQDTELTPNLVNLYLNSAIGFAVKSNYKEEVQINGIESVSDAFYATFPGITISYDDSLAQYNATLPQQAVGVGAGWDISSFIVLTPSGKKIFAHPIKPTEEAFLYRNSKPCNEVFYWLNGSKAFLHSTQDITKSKAIVRMIVSQSTNLDAEITVPDSYMPVIIDYMAKTLGIMMNMPIDISNDGVPTTQVRS